MFINLISIFIQKSKFTTSNKNDTVNKLKNNRCEIVISSLEMARKQTDLLQMFEWSAIIVDEFHKLKNNESITTKAFQTFKTKTRIGLSGTILQNNLIELWSLLNWFVYKLPTHYCHFIINS